MTYLNVECWPYDKYLVASAKHTKAADELRALELRHVQDDDDSATVLADRASLVRAKHDAGHRYLEARKAYEDCRRARVESHKF